VDWDVLGCLSGEDRCLGLFSTLQPLSIQRGVFLEIEDVESSASATIREKRKQHKAELIAQFPGAELEIPAFGLLDRVSLLAERIEAFLETTSGSVVLDVTCMPKRFFFPIIKLMCASSRVTNLVITYTKAKSYGLGDLSGNALEWAHIPMYMAKDFPEEKPQVAIVGVGFMSMGLPGLLIGRYRDAEVHLLFPFPPGPPSYQRNWEFVRRIVEQYPVLEEERIVRVHGLSVCDAFTAMESLTNNGATPALLAPYGPKPFSVAMALLAIKYGYPVYYTQPTYYSPDYSEGQGETSAYLIKRYSDMLY